MFKLWEWVVISKGIYGKDDFEEFTVLSGWLGDNAPENYYELCESEFEFVCYSVVEVWVVVELVDEDY